MEESLSWSMERVLCKISILIPKQVMEVQGGTILSGFIGRLTLVKRLARSSNRPPAMSSLSYHYKVVHVGENLPTLRGHNMGNGVGYHLEC